VDIVEVLTIGNGNLMPSSTAHSNGAQGRWRGQEFGRKPPAIRIASANVPAQTDLPWWVTATVPSFSRLIP